jgi:transcriptional regulator with XRE-family HTH domain
MSLGKKLGKLRQDKKLTQEEAAKMIGISRSRLALYETDKRDLDTDTLKQISIFYNVSIDELLGNEQKNTSEQTRNSEVDKLANEIRANPKYLELHRLVKELPDDKVRSVLEFAEFAKLKGKDRRPDDDDDF